MSYLLSTETYIYCCIRRWLVNQLLRLIKFLGVFTALSGLITKFLYFSIQHDPFLLHIEIAFQLFCSRQISTLRSSCLSLVASIYLLVLTDYPFWLAYDLWLINPSHSGCVEHQKYQPELQIFAFISKVIFLTETLIVNCSGQHWIGA